MNQNIRLNTPSGARETLLSYSDRCNNLMTAIEAYESDKSHLHAAQDLYKRLKKDIEQDTKDARKIAELYPHSFCSNFIFPTLTDALKHLTPATNSNPLQSNWFDAVDSAQSEFNLRIPQI